jgi:cytochrome b561
MTRYSSPAILLHWLMAILILAGFALGAYMVDLRLSPQKLKLYSWHKWIGMSVFILLWLRLAWRLAHPVPPLPVTMKVWEKNAAHAVHLLLYLLMIVVPFSGWLFSSASGVQVVLFGVLPLPDLLDKDKALADSLKAVHFALNKSLIAIVLIHTAAALKHHFHDRDEVLVRMLPLARRRT